MASDRHIHKTVTGQAYEVKRKGGRNPIPAEHRQTEIIVIHTTPAGKARFLEAQKKSCMSQSAFGDLMVSVGLDSYLNQETG